MRSSAERLAARPRISAIICTHNRAALLQQVLLSLGRQSIDPMLYEIIIVDDGSTDETAQLAHSLRVQAPLVYQRQRHAGLASARNHGLFLAAAPVVLFLDDDDVCDERLLEQHLATHERFPADNYAVLGYTALAPDIASDPLMHFVTEVGCFLFSYGGLRDGALLDYTHFWGGRTSCKRRFLIDHGVFNPVFRFGCEDIELGYRLSRHGLRVVYKTRARSTMQRKFTFDGFCERLRRQGQSNHRFLRLHPVAEIEQWTDLAELDSVWRSIAPQYDEIVRRARALDRLAQLKQKWGLALSAEENGLLHDAYRRAFRAVRLSGSVEAQEADVVGARPAAPAFAV